MSKKEKETEIMIFPPLFKKKKDNFSLPHQVCVRKKLLNELKNLKKHIL